MNSAFRIPAGDPNHEARAHHVFTEDVLVRSLAPHMHYRGEEMRYTAYLPDGTERELLSVSRYDFNWQTAYEYAEPVALPAGTRMEVVAHWDNSADNPNNPDPTVDVRFGDFKNDKSYMKQATLRRHPRRRRQVVHSPQSDPARQRCLRPIAQGDRLSSEDGRPLQRID